MTEKSKLIIFDMDNTLIHSRIDFKLMKAETLRILREAGLQPATRPPVSEILNGLREAGQLPQELEDAIWQRVSEVEADGLAMAVPEPGICAVLDALRPRVHLAVLTNNAQEAAQANLQRLGLAAYFECVLGRGGVPALKPFAGGMQAVVAHFGPLTVRDSLAVGDALIDIQAAGAAGIAFAAYNRSRQEDWRRLPLRPVLQLTAWDEAAAQRLLHLLGEE